MPPAPISGSGRSQGGDVRARFAPSPTGGLHLGSAMVALANAAFARAAGGTWLLRIDDTDRERSTEQHVDELLHLLRWLELAWDDGPVHQRDRATRHAAALERLRASGAAYPCFCDEQRLAEVRATQQSRGEPPRYDGRCRGLDPAQAARDAAAGAPHVLRLAIDHDRDVAFDDLVHGAVTVPAGSFGDPVLARRDGSPGYALASVVDDIELGVTHVLRGEDHLTNTARQLPLFEALGAQQVPAFAHLPLLRDADGRKLSKRDALGTLDELVVEGFTAEAVRCYLAELLGQGARDLLAPDAAPFQLEQVRSGAPKVDRARLESIGREHMAAQAAEDVAALVDRLGLEPRDALLELAAELAPGSPTLAHLRGELLVVLDGPGLGDLPVLLAAAAPDEAARTRSAQALELSAGVLRDGSTAGGDAWAPEAVARVRADGAEAGFAVRELLKPLRLALTGTDGGPGLELVLAAIGPREAARRVELAATLARDGATAPGGEWDAEPDRTAPRRP